MPTKIERLNKETVALQKTYDRLSQNYSNAPDINKYLDDLQQRIHANTQEIKTSMLEGTLDELDYTSKKRGGQ